MDQLARPCAIDRTSFPELRARRAVNTVMATRVGHSLVDRSAEFETPPTLVWSCGKLVRPRRPNIAEPL